MTKFYVDEPTVFSLVEETEFFRLKVLTSHIEDEHVEEFLDTTVEWLSTNPAKGILVDFSGVKSVCDDFSFHLSSYYEDIKARGLYVRFVNVAPSIEPAVEVSNITRVINLEDLNLGHGKVSVSAKEILEDLAARLPDRELMKKHSLTLKGLSSVYRKLLNRGLITRRFLARRMGIETRDITIHLAGKGSSKVRISSAQVVDDISNSLSNHELMSKYRLSPRGFRRLLQKLYDKGLLSRSELAARSRLLEQ
jgi:anti-anti-sigma regulatory factor